MLRPNEALGGMDPGLAKSSMVPSKPGLKTLNPPVVHRLMHHAGEP